MLPGNACVRTTTVETAQDRTGAPVISTCHAVNAHICMQAGYHHMLALDTAVSNAPALSDGLALASKGHKWAPVCDNQQPWTCMRTDNQGSCYQREGVLTATPKISGWPTVTGGCL
jgi:hypothetical protein